MSRCRYFRAARRCDNFGLWCSSRRSLANETMLFVARVPGSSGFAPSAYRTLCESHFLEVLGVEGEPSDWCTVEVESSLEWMQQEDLEEG